MIIARKGEEGGNCWKLNRLYRFPIYLTIRCINAADIAGDNAITSKSHYKFRKNENIILYARENPIRQTSDTQRNQNTGVYRYDNGESRDTHLLRLCRISPCINRRQLQISMIIVISTRYPRRFQPRHAFRKKKRKKKKRKTSFSKYRFQRNVILIIMFIIVLAMWISRRMIRLFNSDNLVQISRSLFCSQHSIFLDRGNFIHKFFPFEN